MLSEQYPDIFWNNYENCPHESSVSTYTLTKVLALTVFSCGELTAGMNLLGIIIMMLS